MRGGKSTGGGGGQGGDGGGGVTDRWQPNASGFAKFCRLYVGRLQQRKYVVSLCVFEAKAAASPSFFD